MISKLFYNAQLLTCPSVSKQNRLSFPNGKQVMFITHDCLEEDLGIEEFSYNTRSKINRGEANIIKNLYQNLPSLLNMNIDGKVAIITFYSAQKFHIKSLGMNCDINTVDGYQGQEKDIVIISCVRENKQGTLGFIQCPFRLCTALSRARDILIIVCGKMLINNECKIWRELMDYRKAPFAMHEEKSKENY
jgi:senataxin